MATLTILAVSDVVEQHLYQPDVADRLGHVDLIISSGDLPPGYLDFLSSVFNAPLYHVIGNHCDVKHDESGRCEEASYVGATDLHGRVETYKNPDGAALLLAGIEGSRLYNFGPHQYTEAEVERRLLRMAPSLIGARLKRGRYLDIFVAHAPPQGIHDLGDVAHKGFAAFLPFLKHFRPSLMLHGHTHRYDPMLPTRTQYGDTTIINVYGHALITIEQSPEDGRWRLLPDP